MSGETLPTPPTRCYSVGELAEAVVLTPDAIRAAIHRGEVEAVRIGKQWRIPQREYKRLTGTGTAP